MKSKKSSFNYSQILSKLKNEPYYHIDDACEFLGLCKRTVVNYVKLGRLKGTMFRERQFFSEKELLDYLHTEVK